MNNLNIFFFLLALLTVKIEFASANAKNSSLKSVQLLKTFTIKSNPNQRIILSVGEKIQTAILLSKNNQLTIVATPFQAQSINSARIRAREVGSNSPSSVSVKSGKFASYFYFSTADFYFVFSTRGGRLMIPKIKDNPFDFANLILNEETPQKAPPAPPANKTKRSKKVALL